MATANTALNRPRGPALIPPQAPPPQAPLRNHACHILRAPVYCRARKYIKSQYFRKYNYISNLLLAGALI